MTEDQTYKRWGTPGFIPPEVSKPKVIVSIDLEKFDSWSLGCTIY
jgi:serine/threonine protein kinase